MIDASTDKPPPPGSPGAPAIDVIDSTRALPAEAVVWLRTMGHRALEALGAAGEVRVRVVGDGEMAAAHRKYKGLGGTTDVLTFDFGEGLGPRAAAKPAARATMRELDVDILVCLDEARRQAGERGHAPQRELLLYIVHGLLHCLGYDDEDERAAAAMHAVEDQVLEELGIGATYAREPRQEGGAGGIGKEQD